jgi:hypothetical protein
MQLILNQSKILLKLEEEPITKKIIGRMEAMERIIRDIVMNYLKIA